MNGLLAPAASERAAWSLGPDDDGYPRQLLDLGELAGPPLRGVGALGAVGGLDPSATVTVVGSRRASSYGLRIAEQIAADLAGAGVTIVSGMAIGIDGAAHRGALDGGGRTIAVLAGGPDVVYPHRHRGLYARIIEAGAAISEHEPGVVPRPHFFRERNRIMAALSNVVVIVEAAERSGSLVTADRALDLGRDLGAVPGQVGMRGAAGTNLRIREGATLIRGAQDVLDLLAGVGAMTVSRTGPPLDGELACTLDAVEDGAGSPDGVARSAGLDARGAAVALARLELLGYIVRGPLGAYAPTGLARPDNEE